jgi:tRNA(fMet)-specific endonuclease VapC
VSEECPSVFVLDTDHVVIMQQATGPDSIRLAERMLDYSPRDFYVSIVSFHEQVSGWQTYIHRAKRPLDVVRAYGMFQRIIADYGAMQVLAFDATAADIFQSLRKQRVRIGTMDLRIAATALAHEFQVLTRNTVDFVQVPGPRAEDWTVA